jgi:hypothetical protein
LTPFVRKHAAEWTAEADDMKAFEVGNRSDDFDVALSSLTRLVKLSLLIP